jgi:hypothetical protein
MPQIFYRLKHHTPKINPLYKYNNCNTNKYLF